MTFNPNRGGMNNAVQYENDEERSMDANVGSPQNEEKIDTSSGGIEILNLETGRYSDVDEGQQIANTPANQGK
jgi:hypothetical protein